MLFRSVSIQAGGAIPPAFLCRFIKIKSTVNTEFENVVAEAMYPDLSRETFEVFGRTVRIKPLKWKYLTQLAKVLEPLASEVAQDLQWQSYGSAATAVLRHTQVLPHIVALVCLNDGFVPVVEVQTHEEDETGNLTGNLVTKKFAGVDALLNAEGEEALSVKEAGEIALALMAKSESIGKPVMDFLLQKIAEGKKLLSELKSVANDAMRKAVEEHAQKLAQAEGQNAA